VNALVVCGRGLAIVCLLCSTVVLTVLLVLLIPLTLRAVQYEMQAAMCTVHVLRNGVQYSGRRYLRELAAQCQAYWSKQIAQASKSAGFAGFRLFGRPCQHKLTGSGTARDAVPQDSPWRADARAQYEHGQDRSPINNCNFEHARVLPSLLSNQTLCKSPSASCYSTMHEGVVCTCACVCHGLADKVAIGRICFFSTFTQFIYLI